jgi:hypothetical protein
MAMAFIGCWGRGPRLLIRREGVLAVLLEGSLERDCDTLGNSMDPRGVDTEESVVWLFLRRGGKYPNVFRGIRAISTGFEFGDESSKTQRTCIHGFSVSSGRSADVPFCDDEGPGHVLPFEKGGSSIAGVGARRSTP